MIQWSDRCGVPVDGSVCRRPVAHVGSCSPFFHYHARVCGAWLPIAKDRCGRRAGHRYDHRSRWAMDNKLPESRRVAA